MALSDKNRKILWARSGNRCAICKVSLVLDRTVVDSESVVGEECHIISGAMDGPRHDSNYPSDRIDSLENLILLCANHHKMVDDQQTQYTVNRLREIKSHHEKWVEAKLQDDSHHQRADTQEKLDHFLKRFKEFLSSLEEKVLFQRSNTCHHVFDNVFEYRLPLDDATGFKKETEELQLDPDLRRKIVKMVQHISVLEEYIDHGPDRIMKFRSNFRYEQEALYSLVCDVRKQVG